MICEKCIGVEDLSEWFSSNSTQGKCSYCNSRDLCVPKEIFLEYVSNRFFEAAIPIDDLSGMEQIDIYSGSDEHYVQESGIFISEQFEVKNDELLDDIIAYVESESSDADTLFVLDEGTFIDNAYDHQWGVFLNQISHSKRFFNKEAYLFLDKLFDHIHINRVPELSYIEVITSESELFRARKCNSKSVRESIIGNPSSQLGPVPSQIASNQRMTPAGISCLYCAMDRETCLSEIRSVTGDLVISGGFFPKNNLKLLVLSNISEKSNQPTSLFHENYSDITHRMRFIRKLTNLLSRPSPNGGPLDYISTQYVFEYFRVKFGEHIDGLIYTSVQNKRGKNVVIFPEASTIEKFKYKNEKEAIATEVIFSDPHSRLPSSKYYQVELKGRSEIPSIDSDTLDINNPFYESPLEYKLKFIQDSLVFHKIEAVITKSKDKKIKLDIQPEDSSIN